MRRSTWLLIALISSVVMIAGTVPTLYVRYVEDLVETLDCHRTLGEGESLSAVLTRTRQFPPMVLSMVSVGEESGALEAQLDKVADFYESEAMAASRQAAIVVGFGFLLGVALIMAYLVLSFWLGYYSGLMQMVE